MQIIERMMGLALDNWSNDADRRICRFFRFGYGQEAWQTWVAFGGNTVTMTV